MERPLRATLVSRQLAVTIGRAVRMARAASPSSFRSVLTLSVFPALIPPAIVWLGKHLVDLVVEANRGTTTSDLLPTVAALGITTAALRALSTIQGHRREMLASAVELHSERRLLERVSAADLGYFDRSEWYDRVGRATRDLSWRPASVVHSLVASVSGAVGLLGMAALLTALSPALVVIALASVLPIGILQRRVNREIYGFWTGAAGDDRRRQYLRELLTRPESASEVRAFGLAPELLSRHIRAIEDRVSALGRLYGRADGEIVLSAIVTGLTLAVAYGFVAERGLKGDFTPGDLTIVIGAFTVATGQMGALLRSLLDLHHNARFLEDYFSLLDLPPLLVVPAESTPLPAHLDDGLRLEGVTFAYPGGRGPAVRDISLQVRPGELLAIVGANGAGKSTLVKLLLRFYDPDEGVVSVGGVDVREVDPLELRQRIGVLFQDFVRYEFTLRDNITLGRPGILHMDDDVNDVLRAVHADSIGRSLGRGLDSALGRRFDGGTDLSAGQWQRLALARLLYRNADVWVLDEPTSSLDPDAEAAIISQLRDVLQDRVGIVIAHRFSTVRAADRIAVITSGRITELGTHEQLVAASGTYARLFERQAADYR
jgi:ATP-binding cassette subfamily B protein